MPLIFAFGVSTTTTLGVATGVCGVAVPVNNALMASSVIHSGRAVSSLASSAGVNRACSWRATATTEASTRPPMPRPMPSALLTTLRSSRSRWRRATHRGMARERSRREL